MNRRSSMCLLAILTLGLTVLPRPAVSQSPSLKEQLVGTWTFESAVEANKDGSKTDRWGPTASGLFILTQNGRYSFMIARSDIPKFATNNRDQGTADENKAVVQGILANIGTWSVDEATKTLTTNIEVGSFPNFNSTELKRNIISLSTEELKYTNPSSSTGPVIESVWRRAR